MANTLCNRQTPQLPTSPVIRFVWRLSSGPRAPTATGKYQPSMSLRNRRANIGGLRAHQDDRGFEVQGASEGDHQPHQPQPVEPGDSSF